MRLAILISSCAVPVMAQDFSLGQPIDCALGDSCYIQNYVDHDPSPAASDFSCGVLTYDGYKGTDFALPTRGLMFWPLHTASCAGCAMTCAMSFIRLTLKGK